MLTVAGLFSGLFSGAANDILNVIGGAILDALKTIISYVCTFWVRIPTPDLAGTSGAPSAPVSYLQGHLQWFVGAAAVASILVGCMRMAFEHKGEHGRDILKGMLQLLIVSGCALTVIQLLVTVSDDFSTWILSQALGGAGSAELASAFTAQMGTMLGVSTLVGGPVPIFLAIALGAFAVLASLLQAFMMVVRGGMLVVLTGVLPLTFSFWSTESGKHWSKRSVSWVIAFILYKPAAAIVYATAFQLVSATGGTAGLVNVFTGITLMFLALLALPALLRFVTPMVGGIASGGAGMALGMLTGLGAAGMMPSGAMASAAASGAGAAPTGAVPAATTGAIGATSGGRAVGAAGGGSALSQKAQAVAVGAQIGSSLEGAADQGGND